FCNEITDRTGSSPRERGQRSAPGSPRTSFLQHFRGGRASGPENRSTLAVLVVSPPPETLLVAAPRRAVKPLIHAPQAVNAAGVGGIRVVDHTILEHERAQAMPLPNERRPVGASSGRDLGRRPLLAGR